MLFFYSLYKHSPRKRKISPERLGFIKQKANQGDIEAQLLIGAMFSTGRYGIKQNIFETKNYTNAKNISNSPACTEAVKDVKIISI